MRGGGRPVADPQAGERRLEAEIGVIERQIVLGPEAGQEAVDIGRSDIDGGLPLAATGGEDAREDLAERLAPRGEVHAADIGIVMEPAADFRRPGEHRNRALAAKALEIIRRLPRPRQAALDDRPVPRQPREDHRLLSGEERVERDRVGLGAGQSSDGGAPVSHDAW